MVNNLDRQYFMYIYMYILNIKEMLLKGNNNNQGLKRIWLNKQKSIEGCFNKVYNDILNIYIYIEFMYMYSIYIYVLNICVILIS